MHVEFIEPEENEHLGNLVADVELFFDDDLPAPFKGVKLVGFALRRAKDGFLFVTVPSRAFGTLSHRNYFDYLRPVDDDYEKIRAIKKYIVQAWNDTTEPEE